MDPHSQSLVQFQIKRAKRQHRKRIISEAVGYRGVIRFIRRFILAPKVYEMVRNIVRRDFTKKSVLQPPKYPTQFSKILLPHGDEIIWVPAEKIVNFYGQAFSREQHHYVVYLEAGLYDFERFYQIHRPKNTLQARFIKKTFLDQPPTKLLAPWESADLTEIGTPVQDSEWSSPISDFANAGEAVRLDYLRRKISKKGFIDSNNSEIDSEGPIIGQLLLHENSDFRILIREGNHRSAVLVHLGYNLIPIRFRLHHPQVRLSDLKEWPGVLDGRYTTETVREVFKAHFRPPHEKLLPGWPSAP